MDGLEAGLIAWRSAFECSALRCYAGRLTLGETDWSDLFSLSIVDFFHVL